MAEQVPSDVSNDLKRPRPESDGGEGELVESAPKRQKTDHFANEVPIKAEYRVDIRKIAPVDVRTFIVSRNISHNDQLNAQPPATVATTTTTTDTMEFEPKKDAEECREAACAADPTEEAKTDAANPKGGKKEKKKTHRQERKENIKMAPKNEHKVR